MPKINNDTTKVYYNNTILKHAKILVGTAVTNASGVARFYLTDDGTSAGSNIFNNVYSWSTDVVNALPVDSRATTVGSNYVEITVTRFIFNGILLLGIAVLGSVTISNVSGSTVMFTVIGD